MSRLAQALVVAAGVVALMATGCGGNAKQQRHLSAQLKVTHTTTASANTLSKMRAVDVIKAQLRGRAAIRARTSPAFAKNLAQKFTRLGLTRGATDHLRRTA